MLGRRAGRQDEFWTWSTRDFNETGKNMRELRAKRKHEEAITSIPCK